MSERGCIFCKIAKGKIEAHKVYEDEQVLAFLDVNPVGPGHTLVIPKDHIEEFHQMNEELYMQVMQNVRRIASKMKANLNPARVGLVVHGFEIPHAHIHIIPLTNATAISLRKHMATSTDELEAVAAKLRL